MVSKNRLKLIKSLHQKKYRNQHRLFFVEGKKMVDELVQAGMRPFELLVTEAQQEFFSHPEQLSIPDKALEKISALRNPNGVLGVFHMPETRPPDTKGWLLVLDGVRDPGNLGTIIRLCDWFGVGTLICSEDTADVYNPKVLQATMGSFARVNVVYSDLLPFLDQYDGPIYGTFMEGNSIYKARFPEKGVLIMGNEGSGISTEVTQRITEKIGIPSHGDSLAESLNVANATAICLSELRR
ncbi:TrmH family RNA methyltransferase [Flagellimonas algarum]|uniref:TrmH family RNA methyltransferase n=1 Tax=Flagellimonas algarum TaxID=3230298 RepID=UPI003CD0CEB3